MATRLSLDELKGHAKPLQTTAKDLEGTLLAYPLVLQSAQVHREHVAEQRDLLKWVAAFASAGTFVLISQLRSGPQPVVLSSQVGVGISVVGFVVSVIAAGMYWWRVDLILSR